MTKKSSLKPLFCGLLLGLLPWSVSADLIEWTDWTATTRENGVFTSAQGSIGGITVSYSGNAWSVLTDCSGGDFWTEGSPAPYTGSALVDNRPPCDAIRLQWEGSHTVTFSEAIVDPLMAILSMGRNDLPVTYDFTGTAGTFSVLSEGQGMFGDGSYSVGANSLTGNELHGIVQFDGALTEITWTSTAEFWHGFTFGMAPSGPAPVPEPGSMFLFATGLAAMGLWRRRRAKAG